MSSFAQGWRDMWRRVFTDAGALLLLVIAPVCYSLFYPQPYLRDVVREVPLAVVDLDHSSLSRQLIRFADAHETLQVTARVDSWREAEALIASGRVSAYLVIPAKFRADVLRGRATTIAYGGDASYFLPLKQALSGLADSVGYSAARVKIIRRLAAGESRPSAVAAVQPLRLHLHPVGNTRESYAGYLIPAVFVLILQQTLVLGVGLLAGTLRGRRQPAAGPPPFGDYLGGSAALAVIYLGHAAFHAGFSLWVYDLPRHGELAALALFTIPLVFACVFFARTLAGFCARRESSIHLYLLMSVPLLFVAGTAWPAEMMPPPLRWLSLLIPSSVGIGGLIRLNQLGAHLPEVASWWAGSWGLCALYGWLGWRSGARSRADSPVS